MDLVPKGVTFKDQLDFGKKSLKQLRCKINKAKKAADPFSEN
jgi:hypothetical protein